MAGEIAALFLASMVLFLLSVYFWEMGKAIIKARRKK